MQNKSPFLLSLDFKSLSPAVRLKRFTALSFFFFVLANLSFYIFLNGFARIRSLGVPLLRYHALSAYPGFAATLSVFFIGSAASFAIALFFYSKRIRAIPRSSRQFNDAVVQLVIMLIISFPLISAYLQSPRYAVYALSADAGPVPLEGDIDRWKTVRSGIGGFSLKIPPELEQKKEGYALSDERPETLLFVPRRFNRSLARYAPFEVWATTFRPAPGTTVQQFRDTINSRLVRASRAFEIVSTVTLPFGSSEGVFDEILIKNDAGWQRYTRIMAGHKGGVIILKGVVGTRSAVSAYQRVFDRIASTFQAE